MSPLNKDETGHGSSISQRNSSISLIGLQWETAWLADLLLLQLAVRVHGMENITDLLMKGSAPFENVSCDLMAELDTESISFVSAAGDIDFKSKISAVNGAFKNSVWSARMTSFTPLNATLGRPKLKRKKGIHEISPNAWDCANGSQSCTDVAGV